jgi:hypothetical protein
MRTTITGALAVLIIGCGAGAGRQATPPVAVDEPEVEVSAPDLFGIWVNLTDGVYRVIECREVSEDHADLDGLGPVYFVYNFEEGTPSKLVQRGDYRVESGTFVMNVVWSSDPAQIGGTFENRIYAFDGSTLVIESGSAKKGKRTYTRVTEDPSAPPDWLIQPAF